MKMTDPEKMVLLVEMLRGGNEHVTHPFERWRPNTMAPPAVILIYVVGTVNNPNYVDQNVIMDVE